MKRRNRLLALCLCFALLLSCLPTASAADTAPDIQQQICADYYEQRFASRPNSEVELDDVRIERFYGYFPASDCYIVLMEVDGSAYTCDMAYVYIAGLLFHFTSSGYKGRLLVYQNGTFTRLVDAYDQGIVTSSEVAQVYPSFAGNDYKLIPYTDVPKNAWYTKAVIYSHLNYLFQGVEWTRFAPEDTLSRSMLATVLWRSQKSPHVDPSGFFADVEEGSWYANAVAWANQEGIVYGTGGSNFSPDAPVTRETFATMLYRLSGADEAPQKKAPNWDFKDHSTVSSWAKNAVDWAIEEEILLGIEKEDGYYLDPSRPITRAEAAIMMMRYLEGPDLWFPF